MDKEMMRLHSPQRFPMKYLLLFDALSSVVILYNFVTPSQFSGLWPYYGQWANH